ncbi:MAG: sulfide/dihydroorotate dehydrogenase-like FAD/NAD-binding protein [Negativicutes bacterium]|nr:sulfide/dihydroorotate dehydrogenase-like FAD/NAD-binding protein [Negativicutes bacterium]
MGYKIIRKKVLSPTVKEFEIVAPLVARRAQPGQFVVLRVDADGERIPLTIADYDRQRGTVVIIVQELGAGTKKLGRLEQGEELADFAGPMGNPTHLHNLGKVVVIGGGVGIAAIWPIVRGMKQAGNHVTTIIGAKTESLLILVDELAGYSDELVVATDDGSRGVQGFVTTALQAIIDRGQAIDQVLAVGPAIMMKTVADLTRKYNIKTIVSLNPIMVDGTGMCGACRVSVGGATRFACADGPEFDAHQVDFDLLLSRLAMYRQRERDDVEKFEHEGGCKVHE